MSRTILGMPASAKLKLVLERMDRRFMRMTSVSTSPFTEPRAVVWRKPVPPMCVLASPTRAVPVRVDDDGSDLMLPLQNQ